MACCGKKRRAAAARKQMTEQYHLTKYRKIKGKDPALLNDRILIDYHKTLHIIYAGSAASKPNSKSLVNSIVDLHTKFVNEMLKRGIKHNTPLKKI